MSRMPTRKIFLITCIAGLAAAAVSLGHAKRPGVLDHAAESGTYQATSQMCPAARDGQARTPVYKHYLNRTPVSRKLTMKAS